MDISYVEIARPPNPSTLIFSWVPPLLHSDLWVGLLLTPNIGPRYQEPVDSINV